MGGDDDGDDKKTGKKDSKKEEAPSAEVVEKIENMGSNINKMTEGASSTMNESNDKTYGELMKIMDK